MKNQLRQRLNATQTAFGIQLRFGAPAIAELVGLAGFDWIILDSEHSPQTPPGIQAQLQAIGNTAATPIVRPPNSDPDLIKLYLDMGAMGILAPFVNTPKEAEAGARACRYPPKGTRGWGPSRAAHYGLNAAEYTKTIDAQVFYIPIIESAEAVDNIEAIMAVDGVDFCIVGPMDLAISLGTPFDLESQAFDEAIEKVAAGCKAAGKPAGAGLWAPSDMALTKRLVDMGYRALIVGADEPFIANASRTVLDNLAPLRGGQS